MGICSQWVYGAHVGRIYRRQEHYQLCIGLEHCKKNILIVDLVENVIKRRHAGSGFLQMSHKAHVNERGPFICRTTVFFLSKTLHFVGSKLLVFLKKTE